MSLCFLAILIEGSVTGINIALAIIVKSIIDIPKFPVNLYKAIKKLKIGFIKIVFHIYFFQILIILQDRIPLWKMDCILLFFLNPLNPLLKPRTFLSPDKYTLNK